MDATPFKRDILKELADECHKQGIRLHLYYSHIDWYREDAPWGRTGRGTGRPNPKGDWNSYYKFMNNQLTELLTNYGKIGAIWFDGWWDQDQNPDFDWQLPGPVSYTHLWQFFGWNCSLAFTASCSLYSFLATDGDKQGACSRCV